MSFVPTITILSKLLSQLDSAPVECDGFVRLASALLHRNQIQHQCFLGSVREEDSNGVTLIPVHLWIEVGTLMVDYRARMWVGASAPHGVFEKELLKGYYYLGKPFNLGITSDILFYILSGVAITEFDLLET